MSSKYIIERFSSLATLIVGYIVRCKKGDSFGIVYSARDGYGGRQPIGKESCRSAEITHLYYFMKDIDFELDRFTIVCCINDSKMDCSEVKNIIPLDNFIEYNHFEDIDEKRRSDGIYHFQREWEIMETATPYFLINKNHISLYLPIPNILDRIQYFNHTFYNILDKEHSNNSLLSCYFNLKKLHKYHPCLSMTELLKEINEIAGYVDEFDIKIESQKIIVGQSGHFVYRPGRDDMYIITNYRESTCNDMYVMQLVRLGEDSEFESCYGRGLNDVDYNHIDTDKTKSLRAELIKKYDKNQHFSFLLSRYIDNIQKKSDLYSEAYKRINQFIAGEDIPLFNANYADSTINVNLDYYLMINSEYHRFPSFLN